MEAEFKAIMLKKFAQDEKVEQMNQHKRRMMLSQHKQEVDELWRVQVAKAADAELEEQNYRRQQAIEA